MKAKIRKTGEIVDIIAYSASPLMERSSIDKVSYIDSNGVEHPNVQGLNRYWDFEDICEEGEAVEKEIDWRKFRAEAAKDVLASLVFHPSYAVTPITRPVQAAIWYADELINQLKQR